MPDTGKWSSRELEILGWQTYASDLTAWAMQVSLEFGAEIALAESSRLEWPQQCTESEEQETDGDRQECIQRTPQDSDIN